MLRYLCGAWVQVLSRDQSFPVGTLAVNLIGCLVIGFLAQWADARGAFTTEARAFMVIGVLGGFTTFSSFGNDTFNLARNGWLALALANVGANVVIGLFAVWLGRLLAAGLWR
jgi:fluoride exporter